MNAVLVPGPPYPGAYEHYKGGVYVVHKIITEKTSNQHGGGMTDGRIHVLYESLATKEWHVRQVSEFLEWVHEDGTPSWTHHMQYEITDCPNCRLRFRKIEIPTVGEKE